MRFFRDASIRFKILIPPAILILALEIVVLLALYGLNEQQAALSTVDEIALDRITLIDEFISLSEQVQSHVFRIAVLQLMNLPGEEIEPIHERLEQGLNDLDIIYGQILTKWSLDQTERSILERMKGPMDAFRQQALQAMAVVSDNPSFGALLVRSSAVPFAEFRDTLTELHGYQHGEISRVEMEAIQKANTVRIAIIAGAFLIALAGVLATMLISTRWISRPILSITDLMRRLAEGELSIEVGGLERQDEIGAMARAVEVFWNNAIEKAQLDEELRESEERLKQIADTIEDVFWITDWSSHRTLFASPAYENIWGRSLQSLYDNRTGWADAIHPDDRQRAWESFVQLDQEDDYDEEYRLVRPDGSIRWIWDRGFPVRDESGQIYRVAGIAQDITERKRAEEAISYQASLLQNVSDAIIATDLELRITSWNKAAEQIYGWKEDEVIGNMLDDVCKTEFLSETQQEAQKRLLDEGYWRGDFLQKRKDDESLHIMATVSWVRDSSGNPIGGVTVNRDITERKRAEDTLRESEEKYRTILENIEDSYFEVDIAGNFTFFNNPLCRLLGYSEDELMGMNNRQYMDDVNAKALCQTFNAVYRTGKPARAFDWEVIRKDGTTRFVEASVSLLRDSTGEPAGFRGVVRDVTERKRAETWIEHLNRLKEDLLSPRSLDEKLKRITDGVVEIFDADFARIWITKPGDRCDSGCIHVGVTEGPHVCHYRDRGLHLIVSSGRYTHTDGEVHQRVPFGCYKIGRVAAGEDSKFITSDVTHDRRVHDRGWARDLGLVSFAGYRLLSEAGKPIGVLALFSKHAISLDEDALLEGLANTTAQVIQTARAEESLRVSEERFALAVRGSNDGLWDWDIQNNSLYWSPRLKELLGYADDELEVDSDTFRSHLHPDDREHAGAAIEAHFKDRGLYEVEQRLRTKSGEHRWFRTWGQALWDEAGNPVRIVGFTTDITERVRAEEELRESRSLLRETQKMAQVGGWELDLETNEQVWTEEVYHIHEVDLDYKPDLEGGVSFYAPEHRPIIQQAVQRAAETGEPWDLELQFITAKGNRLWVRAIGKAHLKDGKAIKLSGTFQDITERKQAEEALRESEEKFRTIFETVADMISYVDTHGKILDVNKRVEDLLGYKRDEVIGKNFTRLGGLGVKNLPRMLKLFGDTIRGGGARDGVELELEHKDGRQVFVEVGTRFIKKGGRIEGIVSVFRDVTERKRVEEMKDNLIRDVSHELKTPLAKMQMSVEQLMETLGTPSIDRQKVVRVSEIVSGNVQRLQSTVSSILDLSSLESGRVTYHKTRVQPEKLIRQVIVDMQPLAEAKELELAAELPEGLPQIEGDREKLLRVLTNLVGNAVKFSDQGKIVVSAKKKKAHEIEIAVSDSGRGIPREDLDRVFERFWQDNPSIPGAGIGLAICKTIVEAHGGKIWAESAGRGQGTTVRFTLPVG